MAKPGERMSPPEAALIACYQPFAEYSPKRGGREYRGVRTERYTYVRDRRGPWLLYDNLADPYQLQNLCGRLEAADLQARLDGLLEELLDAQGDESLPGEEYMRRWGYPMGTDGAVPLEP